MLNEKQKLCIRDNFSNFVLVNHSDVGSYKDKCVKIFL